MNHMHIIRPPAIFSLRYLAKNSREKYNMCMLCIIYEHRLKKVNKKSDRLFV